MNSAVQYPARPNPRFDFEIRTAYGRKGKPLLDTYGPLSLLPPIIAIAAALITRQVIPSLAVSIFIGATILNGGNPFAGFAHMIEHSIAGSIARPWNAAVITYCLALGGMIGIVTRTGGMHAVAGRLASRAKSTRSGQVVTALLGLVIFIDDYVNTMLVGSAMRPVTDRLRISREKLAYICDTTAAPVASMAPIATWTAYEIGLLRGAFDTIGYEANTYGAFLHSIPFRFYSLIALAFVFLVVVLGRDFGPMLAAEQRARWTGDVISDKAKPLSAAKNNHLRIKEGITGNWYMGVAPIVTVMVAVVMGLYLHGRREILAGGGTEVADLIRNSPFSLAAIRRIVAAGDAAVAMMWAAFSGTIVAAGLALWRKALSLDEVVDAWIDGAKSFFIAVLVLVLAWGISGLCRDLGTAAYLVRIIGDGLPVWLAPSAVFLLGCGIAFSTGTAYGTTAILMPIAVPLVWHLNGGVPDSAFFATIGAVFTGAVFGDHCSPISDTTIMSSMACGSDHVDHVKTQLPYAVVTALIAISCGFIPAGFGFHPVISIGAGAAAAYLVIRYAGKIVGWDRN